MVIDELIIVEDGENKSVQEAGDGLIDVISVDTGKNLFNKETAELGKNLIAGTGALYNSSVRCVSDYIEVDGTKQYTFVYNANLDSATRYLCCYDKDKNHLGTSDTAYSIVSGNSKTAMTIEFIVSGVKYIRANCFWNADGTASEIDDFMIYQGSGDNTYEPYGIVDYNFAKEKEPKGLSKVTCANAVPEPIIDMQIMGDSIQNGVPTPETPVVIESVGDKTSNIADLSKAVVSTNTPFTTFNYDNATGTIELTSTPSQYDYVGIPINTDLGIKLEVGKTYYCGATVTISGKQTTDSTFIRFGVTADAKSYKNNGTYELKETFTYNGEATLRVQFNVGSTEPAQVKYENIYLSEVDEFEPYGYKVPIKVVGKNLFDISRLTSTSEITNNNDGTITVRDAAVRTRETLQELCPNLKAGDVITFSMETTGATYIYFYTTVGHVWINGRTYTVTQEELDTTLALYTGTISKFQIELGTTATNYEPYLNGTTNIYLKEPLRKVDDYADYIDYKNKKVVRNVGKTIYDENTPFYFTTGTYWHEDGVTTAFTYYSPSNALSNAFGIKCLSNLFEYKPSNSINKKLPYISGNSTNIIFAVNNEIATTVEELKTYLAQTNLEIIYKLVTPTEETIDVPEISTARGTNYFEFDTEVSPSFAKINYWKQMGTDVVETEEIIQDGSALLIISTGAELTQSGTTLTIGD